MRYNIPAEVDSVLAIRDLFREKELIAGGKLPPESAAQFLFDTDAWLASKADPDGFLDQESTVNKLIFFLADFGNKYGKDEDVRKLVREHYRSKQSPEGFRFAILDEDPLLTEEEEQQYSGMFDYMFKTRHPRWLCFSACWDYTEKLVMAEPQMKNVVFTYFANSGKLTMLYVVPSGVPMVRGFHAGEDGLIETTVGSLEQTLRDLKTDRG